VLSDDALIELGIIFDHGDEPALPHSVAEFSSIHCLLPTTLCIGMVVIYMSSATSFLGHMFLETRSCLVSSVHRLCSGAINNRYVPYDHQ
jgi:hypothetical protein